MTRPPKNRHVDIEILTPERLLKVCNESLKGVRARFIADFEEQLTYWRLRGRGDQPRPNLGKLMTLLHRDRILSTFPALSEHFDTKDLKLTNAELSEHKWLLYRNRNDLELQLCRSPFERLINLICSLKSCPKIKELTRLLDELEKADPKAKLAIVTSSPVSILIVYLVSQALPHSPRFSRPCR